jgi:hypothetical protein
MARSRSIVFKQIGELVENLLTLQPGQPLELHVENRLRLDRRQSELRHQAVAGFGRRSRPANQRDHRVEVVERDLQPFEDVIARLRLPQLELRAPADDVAAELDEALDQLEQRHHLRPAADDGEHDDAEAQLQLGVLVEVVENHLRHFAALQLDDDAHAVAVRLVPQVGNALDRFLAHQVGDPLDQLRLVHLVGNLGDDDRLAVAFFVGLDLRSRAHQDRSAAGRVRPARRPDVRRSGRRLEGRCAE